MRSVPEISVTKLAEKLRSNDQFVLLDVRESSELQAARIADPRLSVVPMSGLGRGGVESLPLGAQSTDAEILVLCHHGNRSAQVTAWLASRGWTRVYSVAGGIDEYSRTIDPSVGSY